MEAVVEKTQGTYRAFIHDHRLNYPTTEIWTFYLERHRDKVKQTLLNMLIKVIADGRDYRIRLDKEPTEYDQHKPPFNHITTMAMDVTIAVEEQANIGDFLAHDYFGEENKDLFHILLPNEHLYEYRQWGGWERIR